MSTDEFIHIWKAYDAKLEKSLQLNLHLLKDMQMQKAKSKLNSIVLTRVITIVLGIVWELMLGIALYYVWSQIIMAISFGVFFICTGFAILDNIRDIVIIRQISYVDNIIDTQVRLAALQRSMIRTIRLMWLQLPFWSTFFISNAFLRDGGLRFWVIEIPIVAFFTLLTIFLYRNIIPENVTQKKWVRVLVNGSGAGTVAKAMDFIKEIEDFKKEI